MGGQDAADVTTTADAAGGFETHFFHKLYQEEFGRVRGHFGPVNSVAISPDGKSFTTGGEDGFVRMQHFDMVCSCLGPCILCTEVVLRWPWCAFAD